MGLIVRAEYVCDFCGKEIGDGDALVGRLSLKKRVPGMGRNLSVALHTTCSDKLTWHANPVTSQPKAAQKA